MGQDTRGKDKNFAQVSRSVRHKALPAKVNTEEFYITIVSSILSSSSNTVTLDLTSSRSSSKGFGLMLSSLFSSFRVHDNTSGDHLLTKVEAEPLQMTYLML